MFKKERKKVHVEKLSSPKVLAFFSSELVSSYLSVAFEERKLKHNSSSFSIDTLRLLFTGIDQKRKGTERC